MNEARLHALADGIFAIAMTLLVFELKIPTVENPTNTAVWEALKNAWPTFYGFVISFILLYTYWRAHNALLGMFVKNLDVVLTQLNLVFLMLISLIPFSTRALNQYQTTQVGIGIYTANIALISLLMYFIRSYALRAAHIQTAENWKRRDHRNASIRTLLPPIICLLALVISFWSTTWALLPITLIVILNVFLRGFDPLFHLLDRLGVGIDK